MNSSRSWVAYALVTVFLWGIWGALAGLSAQHGFPVAQMNAQVDDVKENVAAYRAARPAGAPDSSGPMNKTGVRARSAGCVRASSSS